MGRRWLAPLTVIICVVAMTSSAQARDGHAIHGSATTNVVPGGSGTVTSGEASSTQNDLDIILGVGPDSDRPIFHLMAMGMLQVRSSKRTAACLMIASALRKEDRQEWSSMSVFRDRDVEGVANTRALAYAALCLRIVRLMAEIEAEGPPSRMQARRCGVLPIDMKVRTERTDQGFVVTPTTGARDATKRAGYRATCSGTASRITVHVDPKKRKTFRQSVGTVAQVGIASPPSADHGAEVKVTFRSPR